jgi:HEAT repeat protein
MVNDFLERANAVVESITPAARIQASTDLAAILARGVTSEDELAALAIDTRAPSAVRQAALWLLARIAPETTRAGTLNALHDPDPGVRAEAARGAGQVNAVGALDVLQALVRGDPSPTVRKAAVYALGMLGDAAALETLLAALLDHDEAEDVRGIAAEALADLGDQRAIPALVQQLDDRSPTVRFWSAYALGRIGDATAVERLRALAISDATEVEGGGSVASEAADALERIVARGQPGRRGAP